MVWRGEDNTAPLVNDEFDTPIAVTSANPDIASFALALDTAVRRSAIAEPKTGTRPATRPPRAVTVASTRDPKET